MWVWETVKIIKKKTGENNPEPETRDGGKNEFNVFPTTGGATKQTKLGTDQKTR